MFQDVAVKHEGVAARCRPIEGDKEFSLVLDEQRVFPAGQVSRRSLFLNGQDSEQSAVNVKGMRHPDRCDFPHLCCPQLRLDIDAGHIKRLAVYPYRRSRVGVAARFGTGGAQATVENELAPPDSGGWIDRRRLDQARGSSLIAGLAAVGSNRITAT
jgi:hypothetical protein